MCNYMFAIYRFLQCCSKIFNFLRLDLGQGLKRVNFSFEVKGRSYYKYATLKKRYTEKTLH